MWTSHEANKIKNKQINNLKIEAVWNSTIDEIKSFMSPPTNKLEKKHLSLEWGGWFELLRQSGFLSTSILKKKVCSITGSATFNSPIPLIFYWLRSNGQWLWLVMQFFNQLNLQLDKKWTLDYKCMGIISYHCQFKKQLLWCEAKTSWAQVLDDLRWARSCSLRHRGTTMLMSAF